MGDRARAIGVVGAITAIALLAGCSPSEEQARAELGALAEETDAELAEVMDVLQEAGVEIESAGSGIRSCQSAPRQAVDYGAAATSIDAGDYEGQFDAAFDALSDEWTVTDEGSRVDDYRGDDVSNSWARLERGEFTLSIERAALTESAALNVGVRRSGDCIDYPTGSEMWDFIDSLERDLTPGG